MQSSLLARPLSKVSNVPVPLSSFAYSYTIYATRCSALCMDVRILKLCGKMSIPSTLVVLQLSLSKLTVIKPLQAQLLVPPSCRRLHRRHAIRTSSAYQDTPDISAAVRQKVSAAMAAFNQCLSISLALQPVMSGLCYVSTETQQMILEERGHHTEYPLFQHLKMSMGYEVLVHCPDTSHWTDRPHSRLLKAPHKSIEQP